VNDTNIIESLTGLRKFKPYPAYKDSGVEWLGKIPAQWGIKRLKRIVQFRGGGTPTKDNVEYWRGDIPWVSPKDMKVAIVVDTEDKITSQAVRESATNFVPAGSVLIVVRSGILIHSIPVAIAGRDLTLNQDLKALIPKQNLVPEYLVYLVSGMQRQLLVEWKKEGATVESLELDLVANTPTPLPSVPEQHAIAAFLDRETAKIDALVAKKERLIELLQEKRTAFITRAVTKGLDPNVPTKDSGIDWLSEIPAHWEVKRVKNLSNFVTSGSRGWAEHYTDEGALFLRIANLRVASIDVDMSDVQHVTPPSGAEGVRTRVHTGDLLISITALIGAVGVVPEGMPAAYVNQHLALVRLSNGEVRPRWLAYCVLSRFGQEQLRTALYGGTKDGLSLDDIRSLAVLAPPVEEQDRVIDSLDCAGRYIEGLVVKVRTVINQLKELRTALISAAVTGKIDVREETA